MQKPTALCSGWVVEEPCFEFYPRLDARLAQQP